MGITLPSNLSINVLRTQVKRHECDIYLPKGWVDLSFQLKGYFLLLQNKRKSRQSPLSRNSNQLSTYIGQIDKCHYDMVKSRFDFTLQKMIDFNNWKISMHCCFQILHTVHNLCTYLSENLFFRGLWLMLEGGLMKFLAKGATEKIVEDADEKRERLSIMNHN